MSSYYKEQSKYTPRNNKIRKMRADGMTYEQIALKFDITRQRVYLILNKPRRKKKFNLQIWRETNAATNGS